MACVDGTTVTFDEVGGFRVKLKTGGGLLPNGGTGPTDGIEGFRRRSFQLISATSAIGGAAAAAGSYSYAATGNITFTNPSTVFPMIVTFTVDFAYDFQVLGGVGTGSSVSPTGYVQINGVDAYATGCKFATFNEGNETFANVLTLNYAQEVAIGGTVNISARQVWVAAGPLSPLFYTASTSLRGIPWIGALV